MPVTCHGDSLRSQKSFSLACDRQHPEWASGRSCWQQEQWSIGAARGHQQERTTQRRCSSLTYHHVSSSRAADTTSCSRAARLACTTRRVREGSECKPSERIHIQGESWILGRTWPIEAKYKVSGMPTRCIALSKLPLHTGNPQLKCPYNLYIIII